MDLDALHRNVTKLMKFMERFENAASVGEPSAANPDQVQQLVNDMTSMRDQLNALDGYKTQIVEPALKDISDILPKLAEVGDMLGWFQQNKTNLEGAIMVADTLDGEEGAAPMQTDPATGTEPAPAAPESPTGEVSAEPAPADPSAAPNS